jgi:hypothetical protein
MFIFLDTEATGNNNWTISVTFPAWDTDKKIQINLANEA